MAEPNRAVIKCPNGTYYAEIYIDNKRVERVKGTFFSKANCITQLNKRIAYWNRKRNVQIPAYQEKEKHNEQ